MRRLYEGKKHILRNILTTQTIFNIMPNPQFLFYKQKYWTLNDFLFIFQMEYC